MLIDTHCHLDFPEFEPQLDDVVARAKAAGVARMITISTSIARYETYRGIAERFDNVWFTVGTHPHRAHDEPDVTTERLIELAQHPRCVAIGEAGLDYHYDKSPRDIAAAVFRRHIAAARETGLPLVIHSRDADDDMAAILRDEMGKGAFSALLHCFTSSRALAETGIELGLSISFSGVVTFKNSEDLRSIARDVPLDRIVVETDAPFLAPVPYRGKPNEPAFVAETAKVVAALKGVDPDEFARISSANALRVFGKMPQQDTRASAA
jgi:TatD DNase family protein